MRLEADTRLCQLLNPVVNHCLSELLIVKTSVGKECCSHERITDKGADLRFERLAALLPTYTLGRQTVKQADTSVDLELYPRHLGLDFLNFTDKRSILFLVGGDAVFEIPDVVLNSLGFRLGL